MAAAQGLAARLERAGLRMVQPALGLAALGAAPGTHTLIEHGGLANTRALYCDANMSSDTLCLNIWVCARIRDQQGSVSSAR